MNAEAIACARPLEDDRRETAAAPVLVQLVPPGSGGVRDYMECLRRQWACAGRESQALVLSEDDARSLSLADRLQALDTRGRGADVSLLLHFSGYGFERRGLCHWLVRELDQARARLGRRLHLVTMFHELSASGPPWSSAFWLAGAQARIVSRIARASDRLLTNAQHHEWGLRNRFGAVAPIAVWPVFSTVGEPASVTRAADRQPRVVAFGSESTRRRALKTLPRHAQLLARHGIREIVEIGSGNACGAAFGEFDHRFAGRLDEPAIGALLQDSAFGLLDYPSMYLGKSTVFAAYAAHGCVTLNTVVAAGAPAEGLEHGLHFVCLDAVKALPARSADRQPIADAAAGWYANHALAKQAVSIAELCTLKQSGVSDHD